MLECYLHVVYLYHNVLVKHYGNINKTVHLTWLQHFDKMLWKPKFNIVAALVEHYFIIWESHKKPQPWGRRSPLKSTSILCELATDRCIPIEKVDGGAHLRSSSVVLYDFLIANSNTSRR